MKQGILLIFLGLTTLTLLVSCSTTAPLQWTTMKQNEQVVWSDDDSKLATVVLQFEAKRLGMLSDKTERRAFKHQLFTQNPDGSNRKAITEWRDHQNGHLYYMRQAGYFVVESILANGARRFDRINLQGNEILIIETPDFDHQPCSQSAEDNPAQPLPAQVYQNVIPSPDGRLLAHVYSPDCGQVSVEFLHANNLSFITYHTINIDEPMTALWHPENYILLVNSEKTRAWKVTIQEPPVPVAPPNCIAPVTTSSSVSMAGKMVYFDEDNQLDFKEVGKERGFGCQQASPAV